MANSDNVLRCGLTPKHVDVPELLRIVRFEAGDPGILRPEASPDGEEVYDTPIDEFRLSRYVLPEGAGAHDLTLPTPQILLCTAGTVRAGEHELAPRPLSLRTGARKGRSVRNRHALPGHRARLTRADGASGTSGPRGLQQWRTAKAGQSRPQLKAKGQRDT